MKTILLILAIISIIAAYSALVAYSMWWLFFSKESLFKLKPMGNFNYDEDKVYLKKRRAELEERRDRLQAELEKDFSQAKHRKINIIEHHIAVCTERIDGVWWPENDVEDIQLVNIPK
jgi:hypothetical protein